VPGELVALVALGAVPAGGVVLDLGCGTGLEVVYLACLGFDSIGVDDSRRALDLARERAHAAGVEARFLHASVCDLPLPDASVDLAIDRGCLHSIDPEDRPDYAREVTRVLRPGGGLMIRGASKTDEEAGLFAVDAVALDRWFPAPDYSRGPVVPLALEAPAGTLEGSLCRLRREVAGGLQKLKEKTDGG
jgi:ubiquinone/menaquinone biosynthesis C-methylase UbiE